MGLFRYSKLNILRDGQEKEIPIKLEKYNPTVFGVEEDEEIQVFAAPLPENVYFPRLKLDRRPDLRGFSLTPHVDNRLEKLEKRMDEINKKLDKVLEQLQQ